MSVTHQNEYTTFDLGGDDSHLDQRGKRWQGEKGKTDRFSFLYFPGLEGDGDMPTLDFTKPPKMVSAPTVYIKGVGYLKADGSQPEILQMAGKPPQQRAATLVAVWPTDKEGNPLKESLKKAEVMILIVAGDKYRALRQNHRNFPLGKHDVTATCTDVQFQKVTFSPCQDNLLVALLASSKDAAKALATRLINDARALLPSLSGEVCRVMTAAEVRDKLTQTGTGGATGKPMTGTPDASTGEIDEVMENLLDS